MPCMKCDNGKWKWGTHGECKYNSFDECERANRGKHILDARADDIAAFERWVEEMKTGAIEISGR